MVTKTKPTAKKEEKEPEPNLEDRTDVEIVNDSLEQIRKGLEISTTIKLLPYKLSLTDQDGNPIELNGHEGNYFLAVTGWEIDNRLKQDINKDPLRSYSAMGAGFVIPEDNPKKIYGQMIASKAFDSSLLSNRIVNVEQRPYGNFSRSLRLQLERSSAYRSDVPDELSRLIRGGAIIGLETLLPEALAEVAKNYKK